MCLISMKFCKVAILFFKVMFTILIIGNFDLHSDSSYRCSRPEVFCEKGVLRNFTIHRKTPAPESLFLSISSKFISMSPNLMNFIP